MCGIQNNNNLVHRRTTERGGIHNNNKLVQRRITESAVAVKDKTLSTLTQITVNIQ